MQHIRYFRYIKLSLLDMGDRYGLTPVFNMYVFTVTNFILMTLFAPVVCWGILFKNRKKSNKSKVKEKKTPQ